jgi:hypothetical protein
MVRSASAIRAEVEAVGDVVQPEPGQPGVIRWEEPPPSDTRGGPTRYNPLSKYLPLAAELRRRPGDWALVYEGVKSHATSLANIIRYGIGGAFIPGGDYEAVTRTRDRVTRTYARYLGDVG